MDILQWNLNGYHQRKHSIDLTIISSQLLLNFNWEPLDNTYDSDHYPILTKYLRDHREELPSHPKWILEKANWSLFQEIIEAGLPDLPEPLDSSSPTSINNILANFTSLILNAANAAIPRTLRKKKTTRKIPWLDSECREQISSYKKRFRRYKKSQSEADKIQFKIARAKARRSIKEKAKQTWRNLTSTITYSTPTTIVWRKIKQISKKPTSYYPPVIEDNQLNRASTTSDNNFIRGRKLKVRIDDKLSDFVEPENGLPQGSVMSVILFVIIINNILSEVKKPVKAQLFADDLTILCSGSNMVTTSKLIQSALDAVNNWAKNNGFKFSNTKTTYTIFSRTNSEIGPTVQINQLQERATNIQFIWIPAHQGIVGNEKADLLAKKATTSVLNSNITVTFQEAKKYYIKVIKNHWNDKWKSSRSHLQSIRQDIHSARPFLPSNRKDQCTITV
nr:unnamed protein product [Callosobruchus analis]